MKFNVNQAVIAIIARAMVQITCGFCQGSYTSNPNGLTQRAIILITTEAVTTTHLKATPVVGISCLKLSHLVGNCSS